MKLNGGNRSGELETDRMEGVGEVKGSKVDCGRGKV
jgi:hypothetical protein